MTFPYPFSGVGPQAKAIYVGSTTENDTNQTSFSFTSPVLPAAGLYAFVVEGSGTNGTSDVARTLSTLTVGGTPANIIANTNNLSLAIAPIAYLRLAAGGTPALVANFSGTMGRAVINVYRIIGNKNDVPFDSNNSNSPTATALSVGLNVPRGACAIFGSMISQGPSVSFTWSGGGVKEDYDTASASELWSRSGAKISPNNGLVSRTVTAAASAGSSSGMSLSGVSWK